MVLQAPTSAATIGYLGLLGLLLLATPAESQTAAHSGALKGRELMAAGRYEASLPYFQRELDAVEAKLGPDNPSIAAEINDLAEANRLAGRYKAAEALYRRALALDQEAGGKDPGGYATTQNNLALVYLKQGRLEEAERLQAQSLNLLQDTLGPNDPRVAMSLHNLAATLRAQGRLDEARPLQERAVLVADESLGRDNPDAQRMRAALASLGPAARTATAQPATPVQPRDPVPRVPGKSALPPPPLVAPETAARQAGDSVAVQVAAVPRADQVPTEWQRLVKRHPDLAGLDLLPTQSVEVPGKGTFYRVIAGPLASKAKAEALCARLKKAGASCRLAGR
jgi:tetratricopeptide (TPR) repeat protein